MTLPTIEELAREWDVDESLPDDPINRLKAHALLLAANIAISHDTVHSPPPVLYGGDGFAEHMACVLSERWSNLAEDYVYSIVEGKYGLVISHDGLNGIYTVKPGAKTWGGYDGDGWGEDEDTRQVEAEGVARDLETALRNLVNALESKLEATGVAA